MLKTKPLPIASIFILHLPDSQKNHIFFEFSSQVDLPTKTWTCCFCNQNNMFHASYEQFFRTNTRPMETLDFLTTVEYILPSNVKPPTFLFVVDVSIDEEELCAIKQTISIIANTIPKTSMVGLISFGSVVKLHELFEVHDFYKANVFSGSKQVDMGVVKDVAEKQILFSAASHVQSSNGGNASGMPNNSFFSQYGSCDLEFANIVDSLTSDGNYGSMTKYEKRCTGVAIDFAVNLLSVLEPGMPARIITFTGGPITYGPGAITAETRNKPIRQFVDITSGKAPLTDSSMKVILLTLFLLLSYF